MTDKIKPTVSRNDINAALVEAKVTKGSDKYIYLYPEVEGDALVSFLGQEDVSRLLTQAVKDIGRTIHKEIVGENEGIALGSPAYVELFQTKLDNWDATSDNKSELTLALERLNEIGNAIVKDGLTKGLLKTRVQYKSIHSKEEIAFDYEIPQVAGQNGQVSAMTHLSDIVAEAESLRAKINNIVRKPRTKKVVEVAPTAEASQPEATPASAAETVVNA